jgi:hypothetical protein
MWYQQESEHNMNKMARADLSNRKIRARNRVASAASVNARDRRVPLSCSGRLGG